MVIGEALVDLVIEPDGSVEAALGGAPYNTARAASRLGANVDFVGVLSNDRFGAQLRTRLVEDGVGVGHAPATDQPTTLAAAELDARGAASYRFYFDGTSAPSLQQSDIPAVRSDPMDLVFTGGLGLVLEPMATSVAAAVDELPATALLVVDVNSRPAIITDRHGYVERLVRILRRTDVVKVSDEDLAYLHPGVPVDDAARVVLEAGVASVIVTAGASHTTIHTADGQRVVAVPPVVAPIVDTIGAGDTFGGGVLASLAESLTSRSELSLDALESAVQLGHAAAGIVVTRRGADPPRRSDIPA